MGGDDTNPALQSSDAGDTPSGPRPGDKAPQGGKGKKPERATTQADPTQPRAVDPRTGLELDAHGLPIAGVARRRWLAKAGMDDTALKVGAAETETPNG